MRVRTYVNTAMGELLGSQEMDNLELKNNHLSFAIHDPRADPMDPNGLLRVSVQLEGVDDIRTLRQDIDRIKERVGV